MGAFARVAPVVVVLAACSLGCRQHGGSLAFNNNPGYMTPPPAIGYGTGGQNQNAAVQQQYAMQIQELQRRNAALDTNNADLTQQLARSEQNMQLLTQDLQMARQQLSETAQQLAQSQAVGQQASQQLASAEAAARRGGGATITANSSLREEVQSLNIPNVVVRQQQGLARVELPADTLFQAGTPNLLMTAYPLLDQVAAAVKQQFPQARISVEGHTDSDPVNTAWGNNQQLSTAQANAVFQVLTTRHSMNAAQFQVLGRGGAQPVVSNGTPQGKARNRRVELVIATQ